MSQTMLAVLALMLTGLFALNQYQSVHHNRRSMMRHEVALQATGVAVDRLEEIGVMDFDEATSNDKKITSAASLTSQANFRNDTQGNDIDDFHDVALDTFRVSGADTLWFHVASTVTYASEAAPDTPTTGPTKVKKATVQVTNQLKTSHNPLEFEPDPLNPGTITLSQSFTCGSRCAW